MLATITVAYSAAYGAQNIVSDAIGQGIRIASGTQQAFNWKATAGAFVTGAVSGAGGTLGKAGGLRNLTPIERRVMSAMSTTILRSEELRVPGARDLATSALQRIAEGTSSFHQAFVGSAERGPEFVMAGTGGTGAMKKAPGLYMLAEAGRALAVDDNPLRWMR